MDGHYYMRLPLKDDKIKMPNNRDLAEQHLRSLQKRLRRYPDFYEDYTVFMNNIIEKGYAEKVPDENLHVVMERSGTFLTTGFIIRRKIKSVLSSTVMHLTKDFL